MASIVISRAAHKDLIGIRDCIQDEPANPDAATRMIAKLEQSILELSDMPQRGKTLDTFLSIHTEYRFLVVEHYRAFCLYDVETVEIVRIMHTPQDYTRVLFFE